MRRRNYTPRSVHQRPKIKLLGKPSKRNCDRLNLGQNPPHLEHFEATQTLNTDRTLCRDLRKINEIGYSKEINNYLDSRGVDEDGYVVPERVLEYQRRLNLQEEIEIAEELIASENGFEEIIPLHELKFLHKRGMQVVGIGYFKNAEEDGLESSVYE